MTDTPDPAIIAYAAALKDAARWLEARAVALEGAKKANDALHEHSDPPITVDACADRKRVSDGIQREINGLRSDAMVILALRPKGLREALEGMVKPLVWREARISNKRERWVADVIFGSYEILEYSDGSFGWNVSFSEEDAESLQYPAASIEAARSAAQADYTRRIVAAFLEAGE